MGKVNFVIKRELDKEKVFCKPEICKNCAGEGCCKNCGCVFSPDDFYIFRNQFSEKERFQYLKHFLKRGYASIDHIRLSNRDTGAFMINSSPIFAEISLQKLLDGEGALYIRMRNVGKNIVDVLHLNFCTIFNTYKCVGLKENGCAFPFKKRPKGGRELIPDIFSGRMDCKVVYSEYQAAIDWYPYQNILYKLYEEFK